MSDQEEKKTQKKRKRKFARRKRWLRIIFGTVAAILLSLAVAFMTRDRSVEIDDESISNNVTQTSIAYEDSVVWNKQNGKLIAKIYIGKMDDIDDASDDANLSNLSYTASMSTSSEGSMKGQELEGSVHRVNSHYVVLAFDGIKEGFGVVRIDLVPQKIYESLDTDMAGSARFYVEEKSVETDENIREETTKVYKDSWQKFKISWYKNTIADDQNDIKSYQKKIAGNNDLIKNLQSEKVKKAKLSSSAADEIQGQIDDLNQQNSQLQTSIADTQKEIQGYQAKIDLTEKGDF